MGWPNTATVSCGQAQPQSHVAKHSQPQSHGAKHSHSLMWPNVEAVAMETERRFL